MTKILILISLILFSTLKIDAHNLKVRIGLSDAYSLQKLQDMGIDLEHSIIKDSYWVDTYINDNELELLQLQKFNIKILESNVEHTNQKLIFQNQVDKNVSIQNKYFTLGSMSGFYKLDEIYNEYDKMMALYPDKIRKDTIGYSINNLPILAYTFSKGNSQYKCLLTSLHHAREPMGASVLIYYFWNLIEQIELKNQHYGYLLANREISVIPVVNPDGYLRNQTLYPKGGGMWRKNLREVNGKIVGVDLNRNYGPLEYWGANVNGSTIIPESETYRGDAPFSEPESKAIRDFTMSKKFQTALNYHSWGNLLISPFGLVESYTPDSLFYEKFGLNNQLFNKYVFGKDIQTVGYASQGTSDDWFYNNIDKNFSTYSMTPEAGNHIQNFWNYKPEDILNVCQNNIKLIENAIESANINVIANEVYYSDSNQDSIVINFENIGANQNTNKVKIQISSDNESIDFYPNSEFEIAFKDRTTFSKSLKINYKNGFKNGSYTKLILKIYYDSSPNYKEIVLDLLTGTFMSEILFDKNVLNSNWQSSHWGLEKDASLNANILNDNPYNSSLKDTSNFLYYTKSFSLSNYSKITLEYETRWNIERRFDLATCELSTDGGKTWNYLQANRMLQTLPYEGSKQPENSFGYVGHINQWLKQSINLSQFKDKNFRLRWGVYADASNNFQGFYLKDIKINKYEDYTITDVELSNHKPKLTYKLEDNSLIFHSNEEISLIQLFDINGQIIKEVAKNTHLEGLDLAMGIYFAKVHTESNIIYEKIIISSK